MKSSLVESYLTELFDSYYTFKSRTEDKDVVYSFNSDKIDYECAFIQELPKIYLILFNVKGMGSVFDRQMREMP